MMRPWGKCVLFLALIPVVLGNLLTLALVSEMWPFVSLVFLVLWVVMVVKSDGWLWWIAHVMVWVNVGTIIGTFVLSVVVDFLMDARGVW